MTINVGSPPTRRAPWSWTAINCSSWSVSATRSVTSPIPIPIPIPIPRIVGCGCRRGPTSGGVTDLRYHWSAEDLTSLHRVPFAGWVMPGSQRVPTATGFEGWGITNGTASAPLMHLIQGRDNPWAEVFDARWAATSPPTPGSRSRMCTSRRPVRPSRPADESRLLRPMRHPRSRYKPAAAAPSRQRRPRRRRRDDLPVRGRHRDQEGELATPLELVGRGEKRA
jgi:hypothetical protein